MILDPHGRLHRALAANAARFGLALRLLDSAERPWSSATFNGWRLTITFRIDGGDPAAWLAALPEEELPVHARLVADLAVVRADDANATLEVLLLEA